MFGQAVLSQTIKQNRVIAWWLITDCLPELLKTTTNSIRYSNFKILEIMARVKQGKDYDFSRFPSFSRTGSIAGMKKQFYGKDALLVRKGAYIYNVSSEPDVYQNEAY